MYLTVGRSPPVPVGLGLVGDGEFEYDPLAPGRADELDSRGESVLSEAVRDGDGGHADEVRSADGRGGHDAGISLVESLVHWVRDGRARGRDERVVLLEHLAPGAAH